MSQRSEKKRRFTLQIICVAAVLLGGCVSQPEKPVVIHPSVGENASILRHSQTLNVVGLGLDDPFKHFLFGRDVEDLENPVAIGLRDNIMYVADAGPGVIFKYNLDTGRMRPLHGAGDMITGEITDIYVMPDHSFYVTDIEGRQVLHFSENGSFIKSYFDDPNISRPVAVSVNEKNGEVYVADEVYSHIVAFSHEGEPIYGMGGRGEGPGKFRIITDMIRTADGFLVSDRIELSVQILDEKGRYLGDFGEGKLIFPTALALDQYGRIYVAEKAESTIKVFKRGELIDVIGSNGYGKGQFRQIGDMKIHNNKLYVADSLNGRIQVFDILPETQAAVVQP